jgi:hypothetical protein
MTTHHTSLYNSDTTPAPHKVLKQELVTWEETANGLRIARLTRTYAGAAHSDTFTSEHVLHSSLINADGPARSKSAEQSDG